MTGFGRAEVEGDGLALAGEVRSVNHRFLELSLRLPRALQPFENKLRAQIGERLHRGKINFGVSWKGDGDDAGVLDLDMDLARRYVDLLQELRGTFSFREPVTLGQVLNLPDLVRKREPDIDPQAAWRLLSETTDRLLDDLISMRRQEGEALAKDLSKRLKSLLASVKAVEKRSPDRAREAKERLKTRLTDLLAGESDVDEERLILEAAHQAERMECTEECVRLRSHIEQFQQLLKEGGPVGRKLNFLLQEMNREANTIGAKANDVAIAREVIQLKEEIEIVREQVQNIE